MPFLDSMESGVEGVLDVASDACHGLKDLGNGLINFVNSHDPNDLVGPVGYGAARFISNNTEMTYKIQFENDANASAPAQRVFIEMKLDRKLDSRTFRLRGFGFGSYQKEMNARQSVIQEKIDMTEDLGIIVALRGGLDIVNNKASWIFQAINASTGLPPSDPSVGFLPPNNGTTGQGFVTFSIRPSSDVKSLDKITAKAAIIFDQNEPIDTPEVFNTIDDTVPYIRNLTVDEEMLKSGSLVLNLDVTDDESGLDYVNIMLQSEFGYTSLLDDVREKAVVLPVTPGQNHTFAILPVDMIGNVQNLQLAGSEYFYTVYTPVPEVRCDEVNNCSGNGQCLEINYCLCRDGFYGIDCSRTSPPLDPPVLDVFFGTQNNITVPMHILSSTTSSRKDAHIIIKCTGFPPHSYFSAGSVIGDTLYLAAGDFGDILYIPPDNYVNNFTLNITTLVFIESTSEFIERKTSRFIEVEEAVSPEERRQYLRTYLRTTKAPPTSTLELLTKIKTSNITQIQNFATRNPSTLSPKSVSLSSHASSTAPPSTKPASAGNTTVTASSTTMAPTKTAVEKTSGVSAVKQSVIAGIASSLGVLFILTILIVFIRGCMNSKSERIHQRIVEPHTRGCEDNHGIEEAEDETGM
ncbi:uncharacterized protein LOC125674175 [Ostrea edulis]|uniref:uncharacterized protein LOC125674175 n=1 Tax=Ostrea edulis TaxID=37623 RepID=UPI0024AF58A0|nr:uncharacterized protein LOC125674175 [Ostrea edulis]